MRGPGTSVNVGMTYTSSTTWLSPFTVQPYGVAQPTAGLTMRQQGEDTPMRGLFEVIVVDPESGEIVVREAVVADGDDKARLKVLRKSDVDPDDVDIIVNRLGNVRPTSTPQRVEIVSQGRTRP